MVKPPPVEVVACSQVFWVCGFLCSLVSGCYSFVLCISVSIVLDSHVISVAASFREGANKQVISSQADSLIKISRIWADFFPVNTSNQPI